MNAPTALHAALLGRLALGPAQSSGPLTMFPLFDTATLPPAAWQTLDEALAAGSATITEVSEGGSVPTLKFVNRGALPVFLLDGEQLVGAKQNRVLNVSILVPADSELDIPVACVEQGRWSWRSRTFGASAEALFASAKARKMRSVNRNLREHGSRVADQGAVWADVAELRARKQVFSETEAMADVYAAEAPALARLTAKLEPLPGQVGAAFAIGGRLAGIELFGDPVLFAKLFPKVARAFAIEVAPADAAVEPPAATAVRDWLAVIAAAGTQAYPAVGLGTDIRLDERVLVGGGLVAEERVAHFAAFAQEEVAS